MYDQHAKLTRYGTRDYNAITGRWTTKDPILLDGDWSNVFEYSRSNSKNRIDIIGLSSKTGTIGGRVGKLGGAAAGRAIGGSLGGVGGPLAALAGGLAGGYVGFKAGDAIDDYIDSGNNGNDGNDGNDGGDDDDEDCDDIWCDLFKQEMYIHALDHPHAWSLCTYLCHKPARLVSLVYFGPICPDFLPAG